MFTGVEPMEVDDPDQHRRRESLRIPVEDKPFNEFESNPELNYSAFPFLFLLGKGLRKSGSVAEKDVRHMLLQFTGNFAKTPRFIFLLFDQKQRHAACQNLAAKVKNSPKSIQVLNDLVNDPSFLEKLKIAVKDPSTKESISLVNKINPHIRSFSSLIPFTAAKRQASMSQLYAMVYHLGKLDTSRFRLYN